MVDNLLGQFLTFSCICLIIQPTCTYGDKPKELGTLQKLKKKVIYSIDTLSKPFQRNYVNSKVKMWLQRNLSALGKKVFSKFCSSVMHLMTSCRPSRYCLTFDRDSADVWWKNLAISAGLSSTRPCSKKYSIP